MASMRNWLKDPDMGKDRVAVVHCKAGKGRSGTVACSYLISQEGWSVEDALARFTTRRMRNGFGDGVSIPSQIRWVGYVDWWSKHGKVYVEQEIEILEVHVWGLRDGVKVSIQGYVEEGKVIKTFHTFARHERIVMDDAVAEGPRPGSSFDRIVERPLPEQEAKATVSRSATTDSSSPMAAIEPGASAAIFRPARPVILPTSDINIDFERRNKATYGFAMVTSVAHVWFNSFFESQKSSNSALNPAGQALISTDAPINGSVSDSGVFEIMWEAMDGIKGSARKGTRAFDRLAVIWKVVPNPKEALTKIITEPAMGDLVPESTPADWTKANLESDSAPGKDLGLRTDSPSSVQLSRASSMSNPDSESQLTADLSQIGTQSHIPAEQEQIKHSGQ